MATPFAMHAVRLPTFIQAFPLLTRVPGLYFKLHGRHRPVGMKKAEIKRRKRVIPALTPNHQHPQTSHGQSPPQQQLQPNHNSLSHHNRHLPDPASLGSAPPPVDFTTYHHQRNISPASPLAPITGDTHTEHQNPRKRAHSETDGTSRANGVQRQKTTSRERADPAMSMAAAAAVSKLSPMSVESVIDPSLNHNAEDKERTTAQLRAEREHLLAQLRDVEHKLGRLGEMIGE
jgi:hypothetical protein